MATYLVVINWTEQGIRNVRTTTLRAYSEDDYRKIIGGLA